MGLNEYINQDLKEAIKNRETDKREVLRSLLSAVNNKAIDNKDDLNDQEVLAIVRKEVKQQEESRQDAEKAGRKDIAEKAGINLKHLEKYLPKELSGSEADSLVKKTITSLSDKDKKNFGWVMSEVMTNIKGRYPGNKVAELVRKNLV